MTQLVVSGNRIMAHGEDCFLAMGGTVICTATGHVFQNATVVNHDGAIPCDLDQVGYEYHAGEFVPCAPYGKGTGNFAVVCDDCKTIKDSGIALSKIGRVAIVYTGGGSVTVDFEPMFAVVFQKGISGGETYKRMSGLFTQQNGIVWGTDSGANNLVTYPVECSVTESEEKTYTLEWEGSDGSYETMQNYASGYIAIVVGGVAQ